MSRFCGGVWCFMNEKWFKLSVSEIENKLKTNAATGLSRKAARSRCSAKNGTVFSVPVSSPFSYLMRIIGDFAYVILIAMCLLALCFGENETGIVTTVVLAINLFVAFVAYYRSQFFGDALERVFLPRCRVVRDGRLFRVSAANVVRGDVIMLEVGDIVPADARLITSDKLRVKMLFERDKYIMLDKAAESRVYENENDPSRFSNVVHAASIVVSGNARAVVTEVGQYTYVGAKMGEITSESKGRHNVPRLLSLFRQYSAKLSMILILTVFPFSIVSMLLGNATLSLFTAFITAISIAASCMSQFSVTVCRAFYTTSIRRCLFSDASSLVRSPDVLDKLGAARYLFVLDGAMVGDGMLHFERGCSADGEFTLEDKKGRTDSVRKLGELAALYDSAQKSALSVSSYTFYRYERAIKDFVDGICADRGALKIRCNITGFSAASQDLGDPHDRLLYTEIGEKRAIFVSYTEDIINECAQYLYNGNNIPFDYEAKQRLILKYRAYVRAGKRVLVFSDCKHNGYMSFGEKCFVGMLVFSERADTSAKTTLQALEGSGIKPIFFSDILVDSKRVDASVILSDIIGMGGVTPTDFVSRGKPIFYGLGKISSYVSFSDVQICELIDALHSVGETVAVAGFSESYDRIYQKADILVTYSCDEYKVEGKFEQEIDVLGDRDDLSSAQVAETLRRRADIVIPRPEEKRRGGCASLLGAKRNALLAAVNTLGFFRYVVCMQVVRMVLVMVPMLFGSTALDARHVVLGGMIADLFVMFSFVSDRKSRVAGASYRVAMREFSSPLRYNGWSIMCFGIGALFASLFPEIISLLPSVPKYIDKTEYSLIVFVLFHLVAFFCLKFDVRRNNIENVVEQMKKKPRALTVVYPILMLALLAVCFISPSLALLFGIEGFTSLVYIYIAVIPPILSAVIYFFFGRRQMNIKKGTKRI